LRERSGILVYLQLLCEYVTNLVFAVWVKFKVLAEEYKKLFSVSQECFEALDICVSIGCIFACDIFIEKQCPLIPVLSFMKIADGDDPWKDINIGKEVD
jgi:hypothetical protein